MQYLRYFSLPLVLATSCQIIPIIANADEPSTVTKDVLNNEIKDLARMSRDSVELMSEQTAEENIELERVKNQKDINTNLPKQLPTTSTNKKNKQPNPKMSRRPR